MKSRTRLLCLAVLCALLMSMSAAPAQAAESLNLTRLLTGIGQLTPVNGTRFLLAKEMGGENWGLYNTSGVQLIPYAYKDFSYLSYNCFQAGEYAKPKLAAEDPYPALEQINCHALVTPGGTAVSEFIYGTVNVYNPFWASGWVLEEADGADYDYKLDNAHFYRIARCDLFFLGDGLQEAKQILSLTREQFRDAAGHGHYLSVQDRGGAVSVWDANGEKLPLAPGSLKDSVYAIKNWMLYDCAQNKMISDGYAAVKEVYYEDGMLLVASRTDFSGKQWNAVFNEYGEEIMPLQNAKADVIGNYVLLTHNETGKKGLYSLSWRSMLLYCAYDEIFQNNKAIDPFISFGYAGVVLDGVRATIDMNTGFVTPVKKLETEVTFLGSVCYYTVEKKALSTYTYLYAPDGTEKRVTGEAKAGRGSGLVTAGEFLEGKDVFTCYGQRLLKQFTAKAIIITDDDKVILNTRNNGFELYSLQ